MDEEGDEEMAKEEDKEMDEEEEGGLGGEGSQWIHH